MMVIQAKNLIQPTGHYVLMEVEREEPDEPAAPNPLASLLGEPPPGRFRCVIRDVGEGVSLPIGAHVIARGMTPFTVEGTRFALSHVDDIMGILPEGVFCE